VLFAGAEMIKETLKVLVTLAVGMFGLWIFDLIRIPSTTLICKGKTVQLLEPDAREGIKHDAEKIVQIGIWNITIDNIPYHIRHNNDVKVEFDDYWQDKDTGTWFLHMGAFNRADGNAWIVSKSGNGGSDGTEEEKKKRTIWWDKSDLKCSKAPERIF
jgi:hypothetical protein